MDLRDFRKIAKVEDLDNTASDAWFHNTRRKRWSSPKKLRRLSAATDLLRSRYQKLRRDNLDFATENVTRTSLIFFPDLV